MQVTETLSQGLKREMTSLCRRATWREKLNGQLADLKKKVRINGFRPGKVPVEHLRKVYGKSVMADVVQEAIADANKKIVDDNHLRLAREPKVELPADEATIDAALEARGDLNFKVASKSSAGVRGRRLLRDVASSVPTADVEDADVEAGLDRLAEQQRAYKGKPRARRRKYHDRVTVDFDGTIGVSPSKAAWAATFRSCWGRTPSFQGLEEQLLGVAVDDKRTIHVTFPEAEQYETERRRQHGRSARIAAEKAGDLRVHAYPRGQADPDLSGCRNDYKFHVRG